MGTTAAPRLGHVAIAVREPRRVAAFYRDLLDLQIVRDGGNQLTGEAVLLSGDPVREDHELVLFANPAAEHIAFRVETAHQLRGLYPRQGAAPGHPVRARIIGRGRVLRPRP